MNLQNLIDYCKDFDLEDIFSGVTVPAPLNPEEVKSAIMVRCGLLTPVYSEPDTMRNMTKFWFNSHQWNIQHLINIILADYSPIENYDRYEDISVNRMNTETLSGTDLNTQSGSDSNTQSGTNTNTLGGSDTLVTASDNTFNSDITDTTTNDGSDSTQYGKKNTASHGHTIEKQVSAFNASGYSPSEKEIHSGTDSDTLSGTDTITYGKIETVVHDEGNRTDFNKTDTTSYGKTDTTQYGKVDTTQYGKTEAMQYGKITDNAGNDHTIAHIHGNIGVTTNQQMIDQELALLKNFNIYDWIASQFENDLFIVVY